LIERERYNRRERHTETFGQGKVEISWCSREFRMAFVDVSAEIVVRRPREV